MRINENKSEIVVWEVLDETRFRVPYPTNLKRAFLFNTLNYLKLNCDERQQMEKQREKDKMQ